MNSVSRPLRVSLLVIVGVLSPLLLQAEDLDLYSPHPDLKIRPKIILGIDSSESMRFTGTSGEWGPWRSDRLKEPIIEFLQTASGIDVGISTFNGVDRGGSILSPAQAIEADLCPGDACASISVRSQVSQTSDDASEDIDTGDISIKSPVTFLGEETTFLGSRGYKLSDGGQSFYQDSDGLYQTEVLPLSMDIDGDRSSVGLWFPEISIPLGTRLKNATVQFDWPGNEWLDPDAGDGSGEAEVRIRIDSRKNAPPFADAPLQRVTGRPLVPAHVTWDVERPDGWEGDVDADLRQYSADFADLVGAVFSPGESGPLAVIIEPAPGATLDKENTVLLMGNHTRANQRRVPRLTITYEYIVPQTAPFLNAFRFDGLNVPPGAKITSARMEVQPRRSADTPDPNFNIQADSSADSEPLRKIDGSFSARSRTASRVRWSPGPWAGIESRISTPDITAIVQEIIDGTDWCSGNALTLLVDGTGERSVYTHHAGSLRAASLHVEYDPATVDRSTYCATAFGQDAVLVHSSGDAVQMSDSAGAVLGQTEIVSSSNGTYLGLVFNDITLSPGEEIADARLVFSLSDLVDGSTEYEIVVDNDSDTSPFRPSEDIRARFIGDPSIRFTIQPRAAGSRVQSIDLSQAIQSVIDSPGWSNGSSIAIRLSKYNGHAVTIPTSALGDGNGPSLKILRRVRGADASSLPFRTVRDRLIEQVQTIPAAGNTPMKDLYEETARYLTGDEVVHGRIRGEQSTSNTMHRLSDPGTYSGGTLSRDGACTEDDLNGESCVTEFISDSPVYIAPENSECKANHIVLLTDGDPTASSAPAAPGIPGLIGSGACAASDLGSECAVELAQWLSSGRAGESSIHTSTIGFDFSSPLLADIAASGGGESYTTTNAGSVGTALRNIARSALHDMGSFTSPTPAMKEFGRTSHRSDVYVAQFQPVSASSLWPGNLKRYALGPVGSDGTIGLVDVNDNPILADGLIDINARSWWSDSVDGSDVEAGGAASQLGTGRNLLTYPKRSAWSNHGAHELVPFEAANPRIRASDLGVAQGDRESAIAWYQGFDILDEDGDGDTQEPRSAMGSILHSSAVVMNYASDDSKGRSVVFVGTQQGYLHAIDTATGREIFGFLPYELYGNVGLFYNTPAGEFRHGLDGPITTWFDDDNDNGVIDTGEKAFLTVGMRRGGSHYYTLDITHPDKPSLLWSISPTRRKFGDLGQTWSRPIVTMVPVGSGESLEYRRMLVFGNGYRPWNDADTRIGHEDVGALWFVDALTGERIHKRSDSDHREMVWSIAADIVPVDIDLDGVAELFIAVDLGGNVWRIDVELSRNSRSEIVANEPELDLIARLADRPRAYKTPTSKAEPGQDRRFFHAPDVALIKMPGGGTRLGIAVGSGRRDSPFESETINRIYMLYQDIENYERISHSDLFDATHASTSITSSDAGWFIDLESPGEKMLGTPLIIQNRLVATTYIPPAGGVIDPCDPDFGHGRLYVVNVLGGDGVAHENLEGQPSTERYTDLDVSGIPPAVSVHISEDSPDKPVLLVGTTAVRGAGVMPAKLRSYWIED